jgi:chromosome segregation ATPase
MVASCLLTHDVQSNEMRDLDSFWRQIQENNTQLKKQLAQMQESYQHANYTGFNPHHQAIYEKEQDELSYLNSRLQTINQLDTQLTRIKQLQQQDHDTQEHVADELSFINNGLQTINQQLDTQLTQIQQLQQLHDAQQHTAVVATAQQQAERVLDLEQQLVQANKDKKQIPILQQQLQMHQGECQQHVIRIEQLQHAIQNANQATAQKEAQMARLEARLASANQKALLVPGLEEDLKKQCEVIRQLQTRSAEFGADLCKTKEVANLVPSLQQQLAQAQKELASHELHAKPDMINQPDRSSWTYLHHAADIPNNAEMIRLLLAHGASIQTLTNDGKTPLHVAIARGYLENLRALMQQSKT